MKWLLDLPTRHKLFFGFGLIIILLIAVIVTAYNDIKAIQELERTMYEVDFADAVDITDIPRHENGIRAAQLAMMVVTGRADQELWHQDIKNRTAEIDTTIRRLLERQRNDPQVNRKLEELRAAQTAYVEAQDSQIIPLIYQGKAEEAKNLILGIQHERFRKIQSIYRELVEQAKERARTAVEQSEKRVRQSLSILIATGAVAPVLALLMALFLSRIIANPLKELSGVSERIGSGDLTVNLPANKRIDEVGILAQSFARMVENLRRVTRETREAVNVLAASSSEILAVISQIAVGANETATAVGETTTTVEEVKQTAHVSAQKAKYVSDSAQKAAQVSLSGKKAVEESIEGMGRIKQQMEAIAESTVRLSEQSQAIAEIIATVNDLAEQSNLLAVNAAIEAAKAGEQGKGFAVVAQEIKSLAEQSKQATAQVRTVLSDIQKATNAAVMVTEQGSKAVEAGVKQSTDAGESIRMLTDAISESAQAATQIAASSQQQLAGMDQVALAMESIKQASAQNVSATKQAEAAARNLHELGQKLTSLVEQYRV